MLGNGDAVVLLEGAVKDYGSKLVGPIDLSASRGEVMGLIGPNGSGKTTTIRLMLGLIRPTSGNVYVNGHPPYSKRIEALRGVGYSPELPNLPTFFTPRELLTLVGGEHGLGLELTRDVEDVLEKVGLLAYADTKISKLSKGMVQRLSIAQALLADPQILILDEPMIGVDPIGADHLRALLAGFASKGGTVIVSSHLLSEVEAICTSVAAFRKGKVIFSGKLPELATRVLGELTVKVEAEGITQQLVDKVLSIAGVLGVERRADGLAVRVRVSDGDIRPKIARLMVEEGCELRSLGYVANTLEELYRRAVGAEGRDAG